MVPCCWKLELRVIRHKKHWHALASPSQRSLEHPERMNAKINAKNDAPWMCASVRGSKSQGSKMTCTLPSRDTVGSHERWAFLDYSDLQVARYTVGRRHYNQRHPRRGNWKLNTAELKGLWTQKLRVTTSAVISLFLHSSTDRCCTLPPFNAGLLVPLLFTFWYSRQCIWFGAFNRTWTW